MFLIININTYGEFLHYLWFLIHFKQLPRRLKYQFKRICYTKYFLNNNNNNNNINNNNIITTITIIITITIITITIIIHNNNNHNNNHNNNSNNNFEMMINVLPVN